MKERGKSVEESNGNNYPDYYSYSSLDFPCKRHPSSSPVGICAYCLKERLIKLVCSDCGEQRLSSCSCSDVSSYRNSCSTMEVGSVGRISFLIENEKTDQPKSEKSDEVIVLKRSSSSCTEVKRSNGFWRFGKLFRKKRGKHSEKNGDGKSEMWVSDCMGVSRSRSLCSFRGNLLNDPDRDGSEFAFSSAKISNFNESEPRRSGFSRGLMDVESAKISDFNESEPRRSGFSRGLMDVESAKISDFNESEPRRSGFSRGLMDVENAKLSDFNGSEPRRSGFSRGLMDIESAKLSDFNEAEPRKSGFSKGLLDVENGVDMKELKKCVFPVKESDFNGMDESRFIDLNLDLSSETKPAYSALKLSDLPLSASESGRNFENLKENRMFGHGGSCRITVNEKRIKKGSKGQKVWRWIFSHHHHGWRSASKKDGNQILKL